jgi:hypothetical protein
MKITTLIIGIFCLAFSWSLQAQEVPQQLRTDVVYLASDYLEGRQTGTRGEKLAAEYLIGRFKELGLEPAGDKGSFLQAFSFTRKGNPHSATATADKEVEGRNVIAFMDNKAKQTVVIGAHYDHLGYGEEGSRHTGEPAIHNGADDNASGVAAMLFLAEKLANTKKQKNNYLFIAFSAEEMGLHGSKHFVSLPTVPLEEINYVLNMDMIGRLNEEKTLVINGAGTSPVWKDALSKISVDGISIKTTDSGIGPSDHTSFYLKDIPVLHFFSGQHTDYHKPEDDALLVNFEGIVSISNFIYTLIQNLNNEGELAFSKTKDESASRSTPRFKVTLGVLPDYTFEGEGMRIDGVLDGRTAANAGLEDGDIIIQIGEMKIKDIYAYMEALSNYKKGDKAKVIVKRGEQKVEKEVTF